MRGVCSRACAVADGDTVRVDGKRARHQAEPAKALEPALRPRADVRAGKELHGRDGLVFVLLEVVEEAESVCLRAEAGARVLGAGAR